MASFTHHLWQTRISRHWFGCSLTLGHLCQPPAFHTLCVGFLFLILYPPPPPPYTPPLPLSPSFTHHLCHTIFVNHHLSHTIFVTHHLSHTICHTPSLSTTIFVTHHAPSFVFHVAWRLVDTPPSFCVARVALMALGWLGGALGLGLVAGDAAALCVAGVALGDIHLRFAWQAWQAWHLETSTCVSRGRPGTLAHWAGISRR